MSHPTLTDLAVLTLAFALLLSFASAQEEKIPVLIINGQNNHDFVATTDSIRRTLESSGRFLVTVSTTPPEKSPASAWNDWRPPLATAKAVIVDYNGEPWPEPIRDEFLEFLWQGGGAVLVHAANNAFPGWKEWERITGLLWRNPAFGARVAFDPETRRYQRVAAGIGPGAGHGQQHTFMIDVQVATHPILRDFPKSFPHAKDELYHGQRGPARAMEILLTAHSSKASGGSGDHEPIAWVIPYGEGQVFTTVLGHHWRGQKDFDALHSVAFQALMARATEWVSTRQVTLSLPAEMSRGSEPVVLPPEKLTWQQPK